MLTSNSNNESSLIEALILKKLANRNGSVVRPEFYQPETTDNYCGTTAKFYLFYNVAGWTTLREAILRNRAERVAFKEEEILRGLENLVSGLMWLRYYNETHGNISSMTVYYKDGNMLLSDPFIAPTTL